MRDASYRVLGLHLAVLRGDHGPMVQFIFGDELLEHLHFVFERNRFGLFLSNMNFFFIIPSIVVLSRYSEDGQSLFSVLLIQVLEVGKRGDAGSTPNGPEIDQNDLASKVGKVAERFPVDPFHGVDFRRWVSDHRQKSLGALDGSFDVFDISREVLDDLRDRLVLRINAVENRFGLVEDFGGRIGCISGIFADVGCDDGRVCRDDRRRCGLLEGLLGKCIGFLEGLFA